MNTETGQCKPYFTQQLSSISRVNNKEGKRVSNVPYTPCNMCLESNVTSRLAHVTNSRGVNFEFLARDFPKTSYTGYIARLILSSLP